MGTGANEGQTVALAHSPRLGRDADALLQALLHCPPRVSLCVLSSRGEQWWLNWETAQYVGTPLEDATDSERVAVSYAMRADVSPPGTPSRCQSLDQWVYWIARQSRAQQPLGYHEHQRLTVVRGAASTRFGREFARLMVAFTQPMTPHEAAERTRSAPITVRKFLNGSAVLKRIAVHSPTSIIVKRRPPGLFGRLLEQLRRHA